MLSMLPKETYTLEEFQKTLGELAESGVGGSNTLAPSRSLRLTEKGIPTYGTGTFPNSPSASNRQTHTTR